MFCHHASLRGEPMCSPDIVKRTHLGRHIGLPLRVRLLAFISSRAKRYLPLTPLSTRLNTFVRDMWLKDEKNIREHIFSHVIRNKVVFLQLEL